MFGGVGWKQLPEIRLFLCKYIRRAEIALPFQLLMIGVDASNAPSSKTSAGGRLPEIAAQKIKHQKGKRN